MNPRLAAIAGPLKDTVQTLDAAEISIGRDVSNHLSIGDRLLSRRHCLIRQESRRFWICDLDSSNGTFVNGVPVKEKFLEHGDHLTVGISHFIFLLHDNEPPPLPQTSVQLNERDLVAGLTLRLRVEDAIYLRTEKVLSSLPPLAVMARDLTVLLKISSTINSIREPELLERQLLEFIFEVVPAQRGAILLTDESEDVVPAFGLDRKRGSEHPVEVSRTIIRQVLAEGVAILSNDVSERVEFSTAESLISSRISSLLCVPLLLYGRVLGVIYLTTTDAETRFDESHLQLLSAVSGIAAVALENARHIERLAGENEHLRAGSQIKHNMVGQSARMREVYQFIARVAPTNSTVLIRGESGTGKELAAHAIHVNSPRASMPFVAINCAALTETLLESELFGHERGAFTGALSQKKGKLEVAQGGTIFLDEVGEMSPVLQAKLLRVLQERQFERVGGTRTIKIDVRVIAATNRNLEQAIADGGFRQDLYYRLNVVSFAMPPLRERREDIPLLSNYFVTKYGDEFNRKVFGVSTEARACLTTYDWPGNVRELENAIERAVVLGSTELILPEDLPEMVLEAEHGDEAAATTLTKYHEVVREAKKQIILKAFESAGGSYTEAAKLLGVHPNYLHRLIRNLNLKDLLKK
ncbi:MAG TPA: sigma 54-interacting transcriptional regulator [Pyrinomonadaceae bacterium]|jgi:Nif-specific regulatory protein